MGLHDIKEEGILEDHIETLLYFWDEKEDITRWMDWEDKKEEIFKQFPLLEFALMAEQQAQALKKVCIKKLEEKRLQINFIG